ncbi:hypothetical protein RJ639_026917 [Escallonia herrerae]|uniref:DUF7788 domain-containing protein n=1 Tax=Escallonia herrerae TaxID=1293975 RepID=A0AA88X620_9ASTE|nr:hypothetical protein RJ639_026917 [Escallonia herrerae]
MDLVQTVFVSDPSRPRLMPPLSPPSKPAPSSSRSMSPSPPSFRPSNHSTRDLPPRSNSASPSSPSSKRQHQGHLQSVIRDDGVCVRSSSDARRPVRIRLIAADGVCVSVQISASSPDPKIGYRQSLFRSSPATMPRPTAASFTSATSSNSDMVVKKAFVALGLLISELSKKPWKGKLITFSEKPRLMSIQGEICCLSLIL